MSYEIIYQKQFIKAVKEDKTVYVPMVEGGSSNCFEVATNRRSRSWFCDTFILDGENYGTKEQMLNKAEELKKELIERNEINKKEYPGWNSYDDKSFGYFAGIAIGTANTGKTSFGQFKGIYKTGCDKALTIEELKDIGISTIVYVSLFDYKEFKEKGLEEFYIRVETSEELIKVIDEKKEYLKGTDYRLSIKFQGWDGNFKKARSRFKKNANKKKEWTYVDSFYVLENSVGFFVKNTKSGYRYTPSHSIGCKKFASKKEAEAFKRKMKNGEIWEVKKVNDRAQVLIIPPDPIDISRDKKINKLFKN
jgi:hypothetical protein